MNEPKVKTIKIPEKLSPEDAVRMGYMDLCRLYNEMGAMIAQFCKIHNEMGEAMKPMCIFVTTLFDGLQDVQETMEEFRNLPDEVLGRCATPPKGD